MTEIVSAYDLEPVLKHLGIEAHERGDEWVAKCPKHYERLGRMDRNPSWSINANTGQHNCFSCGYSGSVLQLIMDHTEMSSWDASRWLRDEGFQTIEIVQVDHEQPEPLPNLAYTPQEEWSAFKRPPKSAREERALSSGACEMYDIRWNDGGFCLPIRTWRGEFLGYQWKKGKRVVNRPDEVRKSSTLFGADVFPGGEVAILLESPLDVARLWCTNHDGGLASFGVFVSRTQTELLLQLTDKIVVALDNDCAGKAQSRMVYERMRHTCPRIRFLNYTGIDAKDIGEMSRHEIDDALRGALLGPEAIAAGLMPAELEKDVRSTARRDGRTKSRGHAAQSSAARKRAAGAQKKRRKS